MKSRKEAPEAVNETDEGSTIETKGKDYFILIRDAANEVVSLRFPDDELFAAACEELDIRVVFEL